MFVNSCWDLTNIGGGTYVLEVELRPGLRKETWMTEATPLRDLEMWIQELERELEWEEARGRSGWVDWGLEKENETE